MTAPGSHNQTDGDALIAEVSSRLAFNQRAYGKAWTGEDEDTAFIVQPLADALAAALARAEELDRVHRVLDNAGVPSGGTASARVGVLWGDKSAALAREAELAEKLPAIADLASDWRDDDLTVLQLRARLKAIAELAARSAATEGTT